LGQCGHYSEKVRLEAINGLSELLSNNPTEAPCHAALIIATASERTADADSGCRAAQRDLFQKALLPALGKEALQPFIPVVMGHICAAMTHLAEPIRSDSLKLLEIIMQWRADLVFSGYITQVLQHFGDALARPARGRSLKAGSLGALISIVSGLHSFLNKALPYVQQNTSGSGGAYNSQRIGGARVSNSSENVAVRELELAPLLEQHHHCHQVVCWQRRRWPPARNSIDVLAPINTSNITSSTNCSASTAARVVLDLLLDCWMECSPGELSSHPEIGPARAATTILQCCNLLLSGWGTALAGPLRNGKGGGNGGSGSGIISNTHSTKSAAVAILDKIAIYFPILEPSIALDAPLRDQLVQLNVSAAQLLVRFLPKVMEATAAASGAATAAAGGNQRQVQQYSSEPVWVLRLLDWLQGVMAYGIALPAAEDDLVGGGSGGGERSAGGGGSGAGTGEMKQYAKRKKSKKLNNNKDPVPITDAAAAAVVPLSETALKQSRTTKKSTLPAVPAAVYAAALSAVEDILPLLPPPRRREMLAAAWSLWTRTQIKSSSRAKTLAFFSRLLSTPAATLYTPLPPTGEPLVLQEEAASWVAAIPRFLWELGTAAPLTTVAALQFLLDAARYSVLNTINENDDDNDDKKSPLQNVLITLHPQLTPLFGILMPQNIKNNKISNQNFVPGPLASLPESTQCLAIDILYHIPGLPDSTLNILAYVALGGGKFPIRTIVRFIDMAIFKAAEVTDSAHFWGILLALVSGTSRSGVEKVTEGQEDGWQRHEVVVEAGCRAAVSAAGGTQDALQALGPALVDIYREMKLAANSGTNGDESSSSLVGISKVLYGLITLCSATFIKNREENKDCGGEASASSSISIIAEALPEVFIEYVRICIDCEAGDPVVHVARPHAASAAAVTVIAAEPALLLGPTLRAVAASVSPNSEKLTTKSAIETALLLLLDIAGNQNLESELVKCSSEAETVVKAIKTAVGNRDGSGLHLGSSSHLLHRLIALMSQKLGIEL